ncbi:type II toxin-antitoxin system RelE/ParE family toxin [Xenorhabdus siamensis]|uniref:type II toxin-antitoxin system RelE/ParE family toxin n=1 Tax=Xenorhabdus siamensis TaxID=3136254 RepID=UPI0030F3BC1E
MSVLFTPKAKEHIRAIKRYSLRRWGASIAETYIYSLRVTMTEIIARQPSLGRDRSEDLFTGVRSFPIERHIIYYREVPAGIEVLAVLHQTQDPHNHL